MCRSILLRSPNGPAVSRQRFWQAAEVERQPPTPTAPVEKQRADQTANRSDRQRSLPRGEPDLTRKDRGYDNDNDRNRVVQHHRSEKETFSAIKSRPARQTASADPQGSGWKQVPMSAIRTLMRQPTYNNPGLRYLHPPPKPNCDTQQVPHPLHLFHSCNSMPCSEA